VTRGIDIAGKRFNHLIVRELAGKTKQGQLLWRCDCDCGNSTTVASQDLRRGTTISCGCARAARQWKHGNSKRGQYTPEYRAWAAMHTRCRNENQRGYHRYGGRGITVCERWNSFEYFLTDMGLRPSPKHSIDRIDNDGDYEPGNCRWATDGEQATNKCSNRLLTVVGVTANLTQWSRILNVNIHTLHSRLERGLPLEECF
jgi:hypothetical protein